MNIIKVLMTLYFVGLIFVPCNDIHETQLNTTDFSKSLSQEDSHSKDKGDICSPLCTCNCCQMTVASSKKEPLVPFSKNTPEYFSKKINFQTNDFAYLVYDQIWQPPKI